MIIPMLCVTIFVILVVWFLLPRVARLMIHTPTAISIFVRLSMVQLMPALIARGGALADDSHQPAWPQIWSAGDPTPAGYKARKQRGLIVPLSPYQLATRR